MVLGFEREPMSIECLNKAINLQFETQTPTKRLILILLANYCDEKNSCFPSYAHIGKLAGLKDVKHIANIIKEFEQLGFLKIERRYKDDGGNLSNRYHLTLKGVHTYPDGADTTTPPVSTPCNTKDKTKEDTKISYTPKGQEDYVPLSDEDFDAFWEAYPRKENKFQAKLKYFQATKTYGSDKLMSMLKRYINEIQVKKKDKTFVPYASTWLHQKRYLDYEDYKIQEIKAPKSTNKNWYDDLEI